MEADVYASGLLADLPDGLRAPRLLLVEELGDDRTRRWMEDEIAGPRIVFQEPDTVSRSQIPFSI